MKTKLSLKNFVALKEPYGELPVKLDTEIQVGSINAKEPRIALAGIKLNMNADSKISPAKDARNVKLVGKLSLASAEAMDMVTTDAIAVDFKLGVNDLSLTRTKAEISVSVKSPDAGGLFVSKVNDRSVYTRMETGTMLPIIDAVRSLYSLTNCMMLTPCCPSAGPIGGAGVACPAGICSLIIVCTFFANSYYPRAV